MPEAQEAEQTAIEEAAETVENQDEGAEETEEVSEESDSGNTEDVDSDTAAEPATPARRENRITSLNKRLREAEERAIRAETRAEERDRPRTVQSQDPNEAVRIREEKLSLMDATERKLFLQDEQIQSMRRDQLISQIKTADDLDRRDYQNQALANPIYAKHQTEVEKILAEMRRNGNNAPRETVLDYVIGRAARLAASKKPSAATVKAKTEAASRVATSKGSPTSVRTDGGTKKSGGEESLEQMKARILAREESGAM